jgi:hypothetical protein
VSTAPISLKKVEVRRGLVWLLRSCQISKGIRFLTTVQSGPPILDQETQCSLRQVEYYDAVPVAGGIVWDRTARHIADLIKANASDQNMPQGAREKWVWLQEYWNHAVARFGILPTAT